MTNWLFSSNQDGQTDCWGKKIKQINKIELQNKILNV